MKNTSTTVALLFVLAFALLAPVKHAEATDSINSLNSRGPPLHTTLSDNPNGPFEFYSVPVDAPSYPPIVISPAGRRLTSDSVSYPTFGNVGDICDGGSHHCKIGLLCNPHGKCVGPAKRGENCSAAASAYMCENGNWCSNTVDDIYVCEPEFKKGKSCNFTYQCTGGHGCNNNVCTAWFSLGKNKDSSSFAYCTPGLGYNSATRKCVPITSLQCTTVSDCAMGGLGATDRIFYSCEDNHCSYNGPDCWYNMPATSGAVRPMNNYYDKSKPQIDKAINTSYAYCQYSKHIAHKTHVTDDQLLVQAVFLFGISDTTWVPADGNCSFTGARCEVGTYCTLGKCARFPSENQPCGATLYATNNRTQYGQCDVQFFLYCDTYLDVYPSSEYLGSIGKCRKGSSKSGTYCNFNYTYNVATAEYVDTQHGCDASSGIYCNYVNVSTGYDNELYFGTCEKAGSVKDGTPIWDYEADFFCQYNLINADSICGKFSRRTCGTWLDCADLVYPYGTQYSDYSFVDTSYSYYWSYLYFIERQVGCVDGFCQSTAPNNCNKQYETAVSNQFTRAFPNTCDYVKCRLSNVTTDGFTLCGTSDASSNSRVSSSSSYLAAIVFVAMLLFL